MIFVIQQSSEGRSRRASLYSLVNNCRFTTLVLMALMAAADLSRGAVDERKPGSADQDFPDPDLPKFSDDDRGTERRVPGSRLPADRGSVSPGIRTPDSGVPERRSPMPLEPVDPRLFDRPGDGIIRERESNPENDPRIRRSDPNPQVSPDKAGTVTDNSTAEGFDWTFQPVSIADLGIGQEWLFEHGNPNLTEAEQQDYVELIRGVEYRRQTPMRFPEGINVTSMWESAFYRFAEARRQAWLNGTLKLSRVSGNPADPFSGKSSVISAADVQFAGQQPDAYSLRLDMRSHPADFVGRPVVLYGLFKPFGEVELQARETLEGEASRYRFQRGYLWNLQNTETIAIVDAMKYVDPESQNEPLQGWRKDNRVEIPVLVKGWFVKLWQKQPLVFCDVVRILTPRPYDQYIRDHVESRVKVRDDESWLYHETLRQMQVTKPDYQAAIAQQEQKIRVGELRQDIREKAAAELQNLQQQFRNATIPRTSQGTSPGYEEQRRTVERQLALRESRFERYLKDPESFPMFVDVFQNPDRWKGRLVTLHGHVRRVSTYPGDSTLFDGQPLHELWLFTEDSQHNPAVIITPTLPRGFPASADVIDSISVTGCFFKMYVYRAQTENRLAPLLLAGSIHWSPTEDQIISLANQGHIPRSSELFRTAAAQQRRISDTVILMVGFLLLLSAMTVWGKVQRDRREQKRLMSLVDEKPNFGQTPQELFPVSFTDSRFESSRG